MSDDERADPEATGAKFAELVRRAAAFDSLEPALRRSEAFSILWTASSRLIETAFGRQLQFLAHECQRSDDLLWMDFYEGGDGSPEEASELWHESDEKRDVQASRRSLATLALTLSSLFPGGLGLQLAHGLLALNHGEVTGLLEPSKTRSKRSAHTRARLQLEAIKLAAFRHGRDGRRDLAEQLVAARLGVSHETLRAWETEHGHASDVRAHRKQAFLLGQEARARGELALSIMDQISYDRFSDQALDQLATEYKAATRSKKGR